MSFPLPMMNIVAMFSEKITAYNLTTVIDADGITVTTQGADYIISGSIQPMGDKKIQLDIDGQISDGAFEIHTSAKLLSNDLNNKNVTNNTQTVIRYSNEIWKVWGVSDWAVKTGNINKYIMIKYTDF